MTFLTGKALEYAKSIVALLSLLLSALNTLYVGNQAIAVALVVIGAFTVWLTPNKDKEPKTYDPHIQTSSARK